MDIIEAIKLKDLKENQINDLWEKSGFVSKEKFKQYLKNKNYKFTNEMIDKNLKNKEVLQLSSYFKKPPEFNTILSPEIRNNYQVDLMIYDRLEYRGYKYIFGCIDVYSRYLYCIPMKTRESNDIVECFQKTFKKMGFCKNLNVDNEFKSLQLIEYLKNNNVKVYYSFADEAFVDTKNSLIERIWRTLASKMRDYKLNTGKHDWSNNLGRIVDSYNNTIHSSTGNTPEDIFHNNGSNNAGYDITRVKDVYKVGDYVRLLMKKEHAFSKGDRIMYTNEIYKILRKDVKFKNRWILEDIKTKEETRPHMERDFLKVNPKDVAIPAYVSTRAMLKDKKEVETAKNRKKTRLALKELNTTLTNKQTKPKATTRTTRSSNRNKK